MADDFAWIVPGSGVWSGEWRGKETVRSQLIAPLFAQFQGTYTNRAHRILADADYVVVQCTGHVLTKRGDTYSNDYCLVCRFDGGKLKELTEYMDTALAERMLEAPRMIA